MKKFAFIYVILMLACVVPAFSCWIYLSPEILVGKSDLVIEATVKLPEDIAKTMEDGDTILKLQATENVIVPVTFVINEVIKNDDAIEENQTEITVDVKITGTGIIKSCRHVDYVLSEGEKAIFLFIKTEEGFRLTYYPTYKLSRDDSGNFVKKTW